MGGGVAHRGFGGFERVLAEPVEPLAGTVHEDVVRTAQLIEPTFADLEPGVVENIAAARRSVLGLPPEKYAEGLDCLGFCLETGHARPA
ncbi:hypothetical protein GCM10029992_54420 [Glycomyces albus]